MSHLNQLSTDIQNQIDADQKQRMKLEEAREVAFGWGPNTLVAGNRTEAGQLLTGQGTSEERQ
jgi:hypothetical protein